jgi:hypothetical protein
MIYDSYSMNDEWFLIKALILINVHYKREIYRDIIS